MRLYDNEGYREEFMALVYDLLHSDGTNDRANQIIDAFDMAPTVEAEPLFPNDPLTLEELREMDGKPVWVEIPTCIVAEWCISKVDPLMNRVRLWGAGGGWFDGRNVGKSLFAYRRKPEEVGTCQKTSSLSG